VLGDSGSGLQAKLWRAVRCASGQRREQQGSGEDVEGEFHSFLVGCQ